MASMNSAASGMISEVDPIQDSRWPRFLKSHPFSTVFHSQGWLESLHRTYGLKPFALTTASTDEPIADALLGCRVDSWLSGVRLVSIPFSDHCQPLVKPGDNFVRLVNAMKARMRNSEYMELRPISMPEGCPGDLNKSASFCLHRLDLRSSAGEIYSHFHRDCIQRRIQHAEREGLDYEIGASDGILRRFYGLIALTRRRQGLLPQPLSWFRNLVACVGKGLTIRIVSKAGVAIAGILTLQFKDTLVYKYGALDRRFSSTGGMQFLMWRAIQDAKADGLSALDLGRSDWDNRGLLDFKDRWGAERSVIDYWRYSSPNCSPAAQTWPLAAAGRLFKYMPDFCQPFLAAALYRHYA
ncbi:MAG: GNAT family N-acetyltransferase [Bryobacteraceae bacterium]